MENIKEIAGFNGLYSVSDKGVVYSEEKLFNMPNGGIRKSERRALKAGTDTNGYKFVVLQDKGEKKHFKVHRLVAFAFITNTENKPYINHIDGNKTNNSFDNLEWVTPKENSQHAEKLGLVNRENIKGHLNTKAKLTKEQVLNIRSIYSKGGTTSRKLAELFLVEKTTIVRLLSKKTYSNVK